MTFAIKRRPQALSYSSFSLFEKDSEEFYLRYLAGNKAPRVPQENYASIGSAFDARVKAGLHSALFGAGSDPNYEFGKLFEDQVEPHNRDWALGASEYVLESYIQSGAYKELLDLLQTAIEPPRFESKIDAVIDGVPVSGKPDLRFLIKPRDVVVRVVFDWKVKGFCSKHGASPSKGYAMCRDGYDAIKLGVGATKAAPLGKQSQSHGKEHDRYLAYDHHGLTINQGYMESCTEEYADQVSLYGWMLGEAPGDENVVVWIDEIVSKFMGEGQKPLLRVANHRARVSRDHQLKLLAKVKACWDAIQSGHVFAEMSREDNDSRCEVLDSMAVGLQTDGSAEENWFNEAVRAQFKG